MFNIDHVSLWNTAEHDANLNHDIGTFWPLEELTASQQLLYIYSQHKYEC